MASFQSSQQDIVAEAPDVLVINEGVTNSGAPSSTGQSNPFSAASGSAHGTAANPFTGAGSGRPTENSFGSNSPISSSTPSAAATSSTPSSQQKTTTTGAMGTDSTGHQQGVLADAGAKAQDVLAGLTAPKKPDNEAEAHVDNIVTGVAGMIVTAPMAALEKVAPVAAEKVSNAAAIAQQHAANAANNLANNDTAKNLANQAGSTAGSLSQQAYGAAVNLKDTALSYLPASLGGTSGQPATTTDTTSSTTTTDLRPADASSHNIGSSTTHDLRPAPTSDAPPVVGGAPETATTFGERSQSEGAKASGTGSGIGGYSSIGNTGSSSTTSASTQGDVQKAKDALSNTATSAYNTVANATASTFDSVTGSGTSSGTTGASSFGGSGLTDTGRQGAGDKLASSLKPDSQKTYTEQAGDVLKGKADQAASYLQPQGDKSLGQKTTDSFQ